MPLSVMQICRDEANNPIMIVSANNNLVNCNYVIAIDLTDNSLLWKFQVNSPSNLGNYAGGQYTILLDDNGNNPRLLFGAYFGGVYALGEGGEVGN